MKNKIIGLVFIVMLCAGCAYIWPGSLYFTPPWKETDPAKSEFVAENFRYEDYYDSKRLRIALVLMFPKGTAKSYVHKIMYEKHRRHNKTDDGWGVTAVTYLDDSLGKDVVHYTYSQMPRPVSKFVIAFSFDSKGSLIEIYDHGMPLLNPSSFKRR